MSTLNLKDPYNNVQEDEKQTLQKHLVSVRNKLAKKMSEKCYNDPKFLQIKRSDEKRIDKHQYFSELCIQKYETFLQDTLNEVLVKKYNYKKVECCSVHTILPIYEKQSTNDAAVAYVKENIHREKMYLSYIPGASWAKLLKKSEEKELFLKLVDKNDNIYLINTNNKFTLVDVYKKDFIHLFIDRIKNIRDRYYNNILNNFSDDIFYKYMNRLVEKINKEYSRSSNDLLIKDADIGKKERYSGYDKNNMKAYFYTETENTSLFPRDVYVEIVLNLNYVSTLYKNLLEFNPDDVLEESFCLYTTSCGIDDKNYLVGLNGPTVRYKNFKKVVDLYQKQALLLNGLYSNKYMLSDLVKEYLDFLIDKMKVTYGVIEKQLNNIHKNPDINIADIITLIKYKLDSDIIYYKLFNFGFEE